MTSKHSETVNSSPTTEVIELKKLSTSVETSKLPYIH